MLLSIYTFVKDGLFYDYHVVDMLKHHLPLADEIIVNEGYSSDGTFEAISGIDPKIKIFRTPWGSGKDFSWFTKFKNEARKKCSGDWCILLDCDEFIPEWDFAGLREYLQSAAELMIPVRLLNFYANYKVYHAHPAKVNWPEKKMIIHRNLPNVEVWGDGANVRLENTPFDFEHSPRWFDVHHFGTVRKPARLRQKWKNVFGPIYSGGWRNWFKLPTFLFNWFPHNWKDPQLLDDLAIYEGPYIQAVRDNPEEFTRDGLSLYNYLLGKKSKK